MDLLTGPLVEINGKYVLESPSVYVLMCSYLLLSLCSRQIEVDVIQHILLMGKLRPGKYNFLKVTLVITNGVAVFSDFTDCVFSNYTISPHLQPCNLGRVLRLEPKV